MHSIDTTILQAIMNYLAKQPYADVAGLLAEIQKSAKLIEEPVVEDPEPEVKRK
jgi:hypothetical protein